MEEEKEYVFELLRPGQMPKPIRLKESELEKHHYDFLLGELISKFDHVPDKTKKAFLSHLYLKHITP